MKKPTPTQRFHLSRLVLFSILGIALLTAQGASGNGIRLTYNKQHVLAYATNMSISDLLSSANQSRAANGLGALALNSKLNSSAQMKANDMIANDYWAHVSPSGIQPWYWFEKAGYSYSAAGENLAYGFQTGIEVNTAWMNSTTHRENVLGDYVDVGFGIASGPNYQGGENTVVVAHYGKPMPAAAPVVTTQPTPAPTPTTTTAPKTTTPTTTPATPATPTPPTNQPAVVPEKTAVTSPTAQTASAVQSKSVSVFEQLMTGKTSLAIIASIGLIGVAGAGFFLTHRLFMKHLVQNGRKFVLHHPLVDATAVATTLGLIFTTTVGKLL